MGCSLSQTRILTDIGFGVLKGTQQQLFSHTTEILMMIYRPLVISLIENHFQHTYTYQPSHL